jgi:hypothetical protein
MIGDLVRLKNENRNHTNHIGMIISIEEYDLQNLSKNTYVMWERADKSIFKIWFGDLGRFLYLCQEDFEPISDK